jgi:hypothetical protein
VLWCDDALASESRLLEPTPGCFLPPSAPTGRLPPRAARTRPPLAAQHPPPVTLKSLVAGALATRTETASPKSPRAGTAETAQRQTPKFALKPGLFSVRRRRSRFELIRQPSMLWRNGHCSSRSVLRSQNMLYVFNGPPREKKILGTAGPAGKKYREHLLEIGVDGPAAGKKYRRTSPEIRLCFEITSPALYRLQRLEKAKQSLVHRYVGTGN